MKRQLVATIILCVSPFFFAACVSSILKESPPTFSNEIQYKDPSQNFVRMKKSVFPSWKSQKTGNVISLISDCDSTSNASLAQLQRLVEDSLTNVEVTNEEGAYIQEKPALLRNVKAQVDGEAIEVLSISFRRKSCGYVSSLSGKVGSIQQDKEEFNQFNQSFSFN